MSRNASRLRGGEVILAAASLILLVVLFALPWYGLSGRFGRTASELGASTTLNGWHGLPTLRWVLLITIAVALALTYFQATRPAPALPASLSVVLMPLSIVTALGLIDRALISVPGPASLGKAEVGAYLGLAAALALLVGAFRSLREEDRPDPVRNAAIPLIDLDSARALGRREPGRGARSEPRS